MNVIDAVRVVLEELGGLSVDLERIGFVQLVEVEQLSHNATVLQTDTNAEGGVRWSGGGPKLKSSAQSTAHAAKIDLEFRRPAVAASALCSEAERRLRVRVVVPSGPASDAVVLSVSFRFDVDGRSVTTASVRELSHAFVSLSDASQTTGPDISLRLWAPSTCDPD